MVKSYTRFALEATFGIVSSASSVIHIPAAKGPGRAIVGAAEAIHVWDLKTNELVSRLYDEQQGEKAQVLQLALEAQSEIVAAGYSDGSIRVWDLRSATVFVTFNGHRSGISSLAFDVHGTQLVSASADTTIIVWDLVNEQGLYRLKGHKALVTSLTFPSATSLISTSKDGAIKLWDLETQFSTETHIAHKGECWGSALLGSGRLVTISNGTEMKLWQIDFTQPEGHQLIVLGTLEKQSKHRGVGVLYDEKAGLLFCASGDAVQSWKKRTPEELKRLLKRKQKRASKKDQGKASAEGAEDENASEATDISLTVSDEYTPYGLMRTKSKITAIAKGQRNELIANLASNALEVWSYASQDAERVYSIDRAGHRTDIRDVAVSNDGDLIATGSNGSIKIYNSRSRSLVRTLSDTGYVLSLKFLPGDGLLVVGTKEGTIDLYDIQKAVQVGSFSCHEGPVWSLDISSDKQQLVSGGADKSVKFWQLKVVEEEVPGHPGLKVPKMTLRNTHKLEFNDDVLAVKLSPDMRFVAASLLDNTVKVYYRDTLKFYLNLYGHQLPVLSLDISHDSKLLVTSSADKIIKIWGLDFGDCHKSIFGHDDSILRVVFEPQTHNFLSASKDGLVKYWDGTKFTQIQKLAGHHSEVWALAIAVDGSFAVSASHDKTIRIWEMTDEPLFIEEERELELEQQHEEDLADSLDRDAAFENNEDDDADSKAVAVSKHTVESLKAGERLFEALSISTTDLEEHPIPRNIILATLDVSAERYLMDVLSKIKAPILEDALLTFPLDKIANLLKFVNIWLDRKWNVPLVCRVLFFCLRTFHKQLVANKMLQADLESTKEKLRKLLSELGDQIGFNLAMLKLTQSAWDEDHIKSFDIEQGATDPDKSRKRVYTSLAV